VAYSVDWLTKIVTIPTSDLTLVSGTRYSLDMADCLAEVRRLEWAFVDGLWAPAILSHANTRFDFAGVDYAPFDDFINGYTVVITGAATRVDLLGSNNNFVDVLIATGVTVVPSNSAGLQIVSVGSGISQQDKDDIENQVHAHLMENGETFEEQTKLIRAEAAGSIVKTGDIHEIKSADGAKTRITSTANETGRIVTDTDGL